MDTEKGNEAKALFDLGNAADVINMFIRKGPADGVHAMILDLADSIGERIDNGGGSNDEEIADLREELEGSISQAAELRRIVGELNDEKAEAKRIGKEWNDALTFEKAAHNITRDELHKAQGEIERLSAEVAKFAQLKLLLNGGL